jgi:hypothetical protein
VFSSFFFRTHTAVKIAPQYAAPTIHVLDASKSVVVVCFDAFCYYFHCQNVTFHGADVP